MRDNASDRVTTDRGWRILTQCYLTVLVKWVTMRQTEWLLTGSDTFSLSVTSQHFYDEWWCAILGQHWQEVAHGDSVSPHDFLKMSDDEPYWASTDPEWHIMTHWVITQKVLTHSHARWHIVTQICWVVISDTISEGNYWSLSMIFQN